MSGQFARFVVIGVLAAVVHYGLLISLVENAGWSAVAATRVGYVGGGIVSYILNRAHTFASARSHMEAGWRFSLVAGVGFCINWAMMAWLTEWLRAPYLLAQLVTTATIMFWSFAANKFWTFQDRG